LFWKKKTKEFLIFGTPFKFKTSNNICIFIGQGFSFEIRKRKRTKFNQKIVNSYQLLFTADENLEEKFLEFIKPIGNRMDQLLTLNRIEDFRNEQVRVNLFYLYFQNVEQPRDILFLLVACIDRIIP